MPPAAGTGITSIGREGDYKGNLEQCSAFHKMSQCTKPSMKPKVTKVRDAHWQNERKPELFWNSKVWLREAKGVGMGL